MNVIMVNSVSAQNLIMASRADKPAWINEVPQKDYYKNDYFVGEGESRNSLVVASKHAYRDAITKILQTKVFEAKYSFKGRTTQDGEQIIKNAIDEIVIDGYSSTIKALSRVEIYYETWNEFSSIVHRYWVLVKIPKTNGYNEPPTKFSPVWRSFFLPGWGQFYKGESAKGYFIVGGTAVFLTSGFIFSNLKITTESDARNARTQTLRDYYNDNTNKYNNISLACFIVTAALYVYNVIDAIAADGEKVYAYEPQNRNYGLKINQTMYPKTQDLYSLRIEL